LAATSVATEKASRRSSDLPTCSPSFSTRFLKIVMITWRVAICAGTIPAVEAPKDAHAAASMAMIWMASMINAAMIESLAYSICIAQLRHAVASCVAPCFSFGSAASSPWTNLAQYSSNACAASPSMLLRASFTAASAADIAASMSWDAFSHASPRRCTAVSSPFGHSEPATIGTSHCTSLGISIPIRPAGFRGSAPHRCRSAAPRRPGS
jgi:hypothetical protein